MIRVGNSLIIFLGEKMRERAIRSKNRVIHALAHFWWATWAIFSFLMSDVSDSPTLLFKKEWKSKSLFFFLTYKKTLKSVQKIRFYSICFEQITRFLWAKEQTSNLLIRFFYHERPERIAHSRSFVMSNLSDLPMVLFCHERPEQIAHSRSLKWAILSKWAMSEWANKRIPNPVYDPGFLLSVVFAYVYAYSCV